MPLNPNFLERLILHRLNKGPAPMLDLFSAASFEAVTLALDIGLFEDLADSTTPLTAFELAERVQADPDGIATLCTFLVTEGYLTTDDDRYRLTPMTEKWLLESSDTNMGPWLIAWNELIFPFWERELQTAIRDGAPSQSIYEWLDEAPDRWEILQDGFKATASLLLDDVVDALSVPDTAERVIDVGGGHGLYAKELCRRHPELSATVFDVPGAIDAVRDEIPDELADRITTQAGDYRTDDLGEGYDLALVFNVIHAHDPAENAALFRRVADALRPGGRIAVLDQWEGSGRTPVSRAALNFVGLTYLTTLGGEIYSHEEVESWLREAGFSEITRRNVGPLSGIAIVGAVKPQ